MDGDHPLVKQLHDVRGIVKITVAAAYFGGDGWTGDKHRYEITEIRMGSSHAESVSLSRHIGARSVHTRPELSAAHTRPGLSAACVLVIMQRQHRVCGVYAATVIDIG